MLRLFEQTLSHDEYFNFSPEGVDIVCLTLGIRGVKLSQNRKGVIQLPAIKVDNIMDATGAAMPFWSGFFILQYIDEKPVEKMLGCALRGASASERERARSSRLP